jgi:hypothetical protein
MRQGYFFAQGWFATVQLVLQADWQEVLQAPQVFSVALSEGPCIVLICFMSFLHGRLRG